MDTFSWATKSPPRPVEELRSPVVQRLRSDELFFRKSFRHVNNDSDPADFSIHLFSESLIHIPGIFIQNLSERPIHIARNPHFRQFVPRYEHISLADYQWNADQLNKYGATLKQ